MNSIPERIAKQLEELVKENKGIKTTFYINANAAFYANTNVAIIEKVESDFINGTSSLDKKPTGFLNV